MKWILIFTLWSSSHNPYTSAAVAVTTAEFNTEQACKVAADDLNKDDWGNLYHEAKCFEKGDNKLP